MDDLQLLREFRADLPAARVERREAARAALLTRIEHSQRSARPSKPPKLGGRKLQFVLAGAVLAALLIAVPTLILGGRGEVDSAAAQALRKFAAAAAAEPPLEPGHYAYTRTKSAYLTTTVEGGGSWSVLVPHEEEHWIALDGSRRVRATTGKPSFPSAEQHAKWVAAGSPDLIPNAGEVSEENYGKLKGRFLDFSGLPTDPTELRALIEARKTRGIQGPPGEAETFVLIGEMLTETYESPQLKAAIYEVAAELPNVELLGGVHDPLGRPGIAVSFTDQRRGTREELIFEPHNAAFLGERETVINSRRWGVAPGTVVGYVSYLESKLVDSTANPDGSRAIPPGVHKVSLVGVSVEGTPLKEGSTTDLQLEKSREAPVVEVEFQNQGESTEYGVSASASINGTVQPGISGIGSIAPGKTASVSIPLEPEPSGQVMLEVELETAPGQQPSENNKRTYAVNFE